MRPSWVHAATRSLVNSVLGRRKPHSIARGPSVALSCHGMLAEKYIGQTPYPWRSSGERRVTFLIEPTHVLTMGG